MAAHKVREITLRLVVDDDGPAADSIGDMLGNGIDWPEWLVEVATISEETRDATGEEAESMAWDDGLEGSD